MKKIILILFISSIYYLQAQEFRLLRPVPDDIQTNGSYLYGEPSIHGGTSAHNGIDILVRYDTVYAAEDGLITFVGYIPGDTTAFSGYEPNGAGNYLFLRIEWNNTYYYLLYGHLTRPFVSSNQSVIKGQPVALSGTTGYSTGPHLHFEIRKGSQFSATGNKRNAELWCAITGMGVIYGKVPNASNSTEVKITPDPKPRPPYTTYGYSLTYQFADPYIGSDDIYNENYAIGDVKPGTYTITALNGSYRRVVTVAAGQVVNADATTDVENENIVLDGFKLSQNFPNPFNPTTIINFQLSERSYVKLTVYDLLGKEVTTLVDQERESGTFNEIFNAMDLPDSKASLPSGIYIYSLIAQPINRGNIFRENKKMILLK